MFSNQSLSFLYISEKYLKTEIQGGGHFEMWSQVGVIWRHDWHVILNKVNELDALHAILVWILFKTRGHKGLKRYTSAWGL